MNCDKDEIWERAVVVRYWLLPGVTKRKKKTASMGQAVFYLRFEQNTNL
jgi:hypothetical protein